MLPQTLQSIALTIAEARRPDEVLDLIVAGLSREPGVALVRIWLLGPGDVCGSCAFAEECSDRRRCLHLVASAGSSQVDPDLDWTGVDGRFRRFPLGVRKVGRVGATGEAALLEVGRDEGWVAKPEWARAEGIDCFGAQPLVFRGEVQGVLALFSRTPVSQEQFAWMRTLADHAAVALANARAFEEVEALRTQLELERDYLREEIKEVQSLGRVVGESPAVVHVMSQVDVVAPTEATVLIEGESGTGKELIAIEVHEKSGRAGQPMVRVNCASIPRELFESEFFGHVQGSFTGATRDRAGRFQVADGGTLFLDEVGEIPIELQGKLLRALQEGQFSRVGEDHERSVDVRVIAATNRDLQAEVKAGRFRADLYYRLTVFPIQLPPLRERREDIAPLVRHFLERAHSKLELRRSDIELLISYDWPGNIRELQNVVERALISSGKRLRFQLPAGPLAAPKDAPTPSLMTDRQLREVERANLVAVLDHVRWKVAGPGGAAEFLGLHPATLASRLKAHGIERPRRST